MSSENPKHILIFTGEFPPTVGGIARYLEGLARGLHEVGEKVTVIAPEHPDQFSSDEQLPFKVIRWDMSYRGIPYLQERRWARQLPKVMKTVGAQYLLSGIWMPCGLVASWVRPRLPFAQIYYAAELIQPRKDLGSRLLDYFKMRTVRSASLHFPISSFSRDLLLKWGRSEESITTLPPGLSALPKLSNPNRNALRDRLDWKDRIVLLTVARLAPHKGQQRVIEVLPELVNQKPEILYVIVGSGPNEKSLRAKVSEKRLENHVIFAGSLSDSELSEYYTAADAFVLLSEQMTVGKRTFVEGFGIVFLEAYHFGLPVVGGDCGGVRDVVRDRETGRLVDPKDPKAVLDALTEVCLDTQTRNRYAKRAREIVAEYQWINTATKCSEALNSLGHRLLNSVGK